MNIYSVNEAKSKLFDIINETDQSHEPVYIKNESGQPDAVIISKEDYESLMETAYLRANPDFVKSIQEAVNIKDCVRHEDIKW